MADLRPNTEKLIRSNLKWIKNHPNPYCDADYESEENIYLWNGYIIGPEGSPYEGGRFEFQIMFPPDFPITDPRVKITTKIYHPNVVKGGTLNLALFPEWNITVQIQKLLLQMRELLKNPDVNIAIMQQIATEMKENREVYEKTAREWTDKYAM